MKWVGGSIIRTNRDPPLLHLLGNLGFLGAGGISTQKFHFVSHKFEWFPKEDSFE
jgi:hypothetical protein